MINPTAGVSSATYAGLSRLFNPESRYKADYKASGSKDDYKTFLKKATFGKMPGHSGRSSKFQSRDMSYLAKEFGVDQEQMMRHFTGGKSEVTMGKRKRSRYVSPSRASGADDAIEIGMKNLLGLI